MTETPTKKIIISKESNINGYCGTCSVSILISGRGRYNIFEGKKSVSENLAGRLSSVLQVPVLQECVVSSIICSKCKRELEKFERLETDLRKFREIYDNSLKQQRNVTDENIQVDGGENSERFKRCKGNSPSIDGKNKRSRRKLIEIHNNTAIHPELEVHEDLICHPEPKARSAIVQVCKSNNLSLLDFRTKYFINLE